MTSEFLETLLRACLVASLASLLIMVLRTPLRRLFGASIPYALWGLIPLALILVSVPSARPEPHHIQLITQPVAGYITGHLPPSPAGETLYPTVIAYGWLAGSLVLALGFLLQQLYFIRKLGTLTPAKAFYIANSNQLGPLLLGLWHPRIVVPADFFRRFNKPQQQLIIAHEQEHARRKDPLCNLVCTLIQILFWFNPLIHLAAKRYRTDQELSCDQRVLKRYPGTRRLYAETLLASNHNDTFYPMACSIKPYQNTKERIMNIHQPQKSSHIIRLGKIALIILLASGGIGARALSPAMVGNLAASDQDGTSTSTAFKVSFEINIDGVTRSPVLISEENELAVIAIEGKTASWHIDYTLEPVDMGAEGMATMMNFNIHKNHESISQPAVLVKIGEIAKIQINNEKVSESVFTIAIKPSLY